MRQHTPHLPILPVCALTWPVRVVVPAVRDEGGQAGAPLLALQQVTVVHVVVGGGAGLYRAVGPVGRGGDCGGGDGVMDDNGGGGVCVRCVGLW